MNTLHSNVMMEVLEASVLEVNKHRLTQTHAHTYR